MGTYGLGWMGPLAARSGGGQGELTLGIRKHFFLERAMLHCTAAQGGEVAAPGVFQKCGDVGIGHGGVGKGCGCPVEC